MDTDKIIQDLNRRFAAPLPEFYQRRIIFWYDEDKEFEDKLDEVVLENAKVITCLLYTSCGLNRRYLIYHGYNVNQMNMQNIMLCQKAEVQEDFMEITNM